MTLVWTLLIGTSFVLIISAVENAPLIDTVKWVWNGAQGTPSAGLVSTGTAPQTSSNTSNSGNFGSVVQTSAPFGR